MSRCAEVCTVEMDVDGTSEFSREKIVAARKVYKCCECLREIAVGTRHEYYSGKYDGDFFTVRTCLVCREIRKAFFCQWLFGEMWGSIREQLFPVWNRSGPYDCLAKLTTEAARDKCRAEYADYQQDSSDD